MFDRTWAIAEVARRLNANVTDPWIGDAVDAAIAYVTVYIDADPVSVDPPIPDTDSLAWAGVVRLAERIVQDAGVQGNELSALADFSLAGVEIPTDLARRLESYWHHLKQRWGVA